MKKLSVRQRLEKLQRVYTTLSDTNKVIVRVHNLPFLYRELCLIVIEEEKFLFGWIAMKSRNLDQWEIVAHEGKAKEFFEKVKKAMAMKKIDWEPVRTAIAEKKPTVVQDISNDKERMAWREEALSCGFRSSGTFPIIIEGKVEGCLNFYSGKRAFFDKDTMKLLGQIAADISFAIEYSYQEEERKQAELELRASELRFRELFDGAPVGYHEIDMEGRIKRVNQTELLMLGYTQEEMLDHYVWEFVKNTEVSRRAVYDKLAGKLDVTKSFERDYRHKEGRSITYLIKDSILHDSKGRVSGIRTTLQDITERKLAEESVRLSEEKYRSFFENDLTGDCIVEPSGKILACNPAFVKIFGFNSMEEALLANITRLYKSPERAQNLLSLLRQRKKVEYFELEMQKIDGQTVYAILNAIAKFDEADNLTEIDVYIFDDTQRKRLEEEILQAQKIKSIGTLAGGIAHDFNNILGIITGYAELLEHNVTDEGKRNIKVMQEAINRGITLVNQILTYARRTDFKSVPIDVNEIIKDVSDMIRETFPKVIEIKTELQPSLPKIIGDSTHLHQALLNLAVNARDALPNGGTITFRTRLVASEKVKKRFPATATEDYIQVNVEDNGIGMSKETTNRIFEPFFSTKEQGKGTGLGLSVVYGIVSSLNGFINVESVIGVGTTFYIYFPAFQIEIQPIGQEERIEEISGGNETILLVEDEEAIRSLASAKLKMKGYTVLIAKDGVEAINVFKEHQSEISLVFSDLGLPKLDGLSVLKAIKAIRNDIKGILASGFFDPQMKDELSKEGILTLQKPYSSNQLFKIVREVLDIS